MNTELIARLRIAARRDSLFGDDVREHASEQAADALEAAQAEVECAKEDQRVCATWLQEARATITDQARDILNMSESLQYIAGIVTHGTGNPMDNGTLIHRGILKYVQSLESRLQAAQAEIERLKAELGDALATIELDGARLAALEQQEPVIAVHEDALKELSAANGMNLWAENAQLFEGRSGEHGYNTPLPEGFVNLYAASVATEQSKEWTDENVIAWCIERGIKSAQPSQARELPKHPVVLSRDDTEHGVYYYKASEVDAIIAAINVKEQPSQARELSDTQLLDYLQSAQDGVVICTHEKRSLKTDGSNDYEIRLVFDGWTTHSRITDEEKPTVRDAIIAAINAKEQT